MRNVLYLHGFASGPNSNKARFFARHFGRIGVTMHCPDLAQGDFERLTLTKQLWLIDQLVQQLQPALIVGSSLGGYLAALHASLNPDGTSRLVLMAPAFGFPRGWEQRLGEERMAEWRDKGTIDVYNYAAEGLLPLRYEFYEDARKFDPLPDVRRPTLIFHGNKDEDVSPELSVKFAGHKPHVELELVNSDHALTDVLEIIWTRTAEFYHHPETVSASEA